MNLTRQDIGKRRSRMGQPAALRSSLLAVVLGAFAPVVCGVGPGTAQERGDPAKYRDPAAVDTVTKKPIVVDPINVTVTRAPKEIFVTPAPVSVLGAPFVRERVPNTAADLLRDLPGLDVNGVGANQARPIIRGQRGQRILLLTDGLRLNNSRRQQDFGELPAIVNVYDLERIEVVRGPASVLYGSDAIGGVVNMIRDDPPPLSGGNLFGGEIRYVYRDEGSQHRPGVDLFGRIGKVGFRASGAFRDTKPYSAPAGTFGDVVLERDVLVEDTGVRDGNVNLFADISFTPSQRVFGRVEAYRATDAGFGFVSNEDLGLEDAPDIVIRYPDQRVNRYSLGYRGLDLGTAVADRLDVTGYYLDNERDFTLDVFVPFGPGTPPGAGVSVQNDNFTDIETVGFRIEAAKLATEDLVLTYGVDFFHDDSFNTDRSVTTVVGFGPPEPEESRVPSVPNATYQGLGVFAQGDLRIVDRVSLILGARFQNTRAETRETEGLEELDPTSSSNRTVVGAANLLVELLPELNLVATVGRGFRAPNIVELFFHGPTPEGSGFQARNPDLEPEKSLNIDLGLKFRRHWITLEGFVFRNEIRDGVRIEATGDTIGPFPVFQNVNVDKLRFQGVELYGEVTPVGGLSIGTGLSFLDSKDVLNPNNPIGDSYSSKLTANVTYRDPGGRFWGAYNLRHSGAQKDGQVFNSLIGETLPAFTIHDLRGGVTLFKLGRTVNGLGISVENLTNELYSEFSNASFFRPEPRRTILVSWITSF